MKCFLCEGTTKLLGNFQCLKDFQTGLYYCFECGSMFRHPMPNNDQISAYYSQVEFKSSKNIFLRRLKKCKEQAQYVEKCFNEFGIEKNTNILDLGAGIGGLVYSLKQRGYMSLRGIEPREIAVSYAKKSFNIDLIPGWIDCAHLHCDPFPRVLLLSHVLEHLSAPGDFLNYLKKHFRGCYLWIEVPDGNFESLEINGRVAWRLWLAQHLWSFTSKGMAKLIERQGFKILKIDNEIVYPFMAKERKMDLQISLEYASFVDLWLNGGRLSGKKFVKITSNLLHYLLLKSKKNLFFTFNRLYIPDSPFNIRFWIKID